MFKANLSVLANTPEHKDLRNVQYSGNMLPQIILGNSELTGWLNTAVTVDIKST